MDDSTPQPPKATEAPRPTPWQLVKKFWHYRRYGPILAYVDDETRRLLGNLTAVTVQILLLLTFSTTAAHWRSAWAAAGFAITICIVLPLRMGRRPFVRLPPPPLDKPSDSEYWRATRLLFLAAQGGFFVLGEVILTLAGSQAGLSSTELALRLALDAGLAGLLAFAYRVQ